MAAALLALPGRALARGPAGQPPGVVLASDCDENQAFVDGSAPAVAALLPAGYTPVLDPVSNQPLLFFRAERCGSLAVADSAGPATVAEFGIVVQTPDGIGCASGAPLVGGVRGDVPPICNWYTLAWLSTDRALVRAFRDGTSDFPAILAPGLGFDLGALDPTQGGAPFRFSVPAPTGTPFTMDAITRRRPGNISVRGGYWTDIAAGTVKVAVASDTLTSGDATGAVHAPAGTPVARLLGATQAAFLPGYSAFAAEHWDRAVYRKQLLWPASTGQTSFSGSCSAQGTVTFAPPAGDSTQALTYDYPGTGTCTGTLDGRQVSNAPVSVHQHGNSVGDCTQAQTTDPGIGTLTFATGETLGYTLDFTTALTTVNFTFYGDRSGIAPGQGTFLTSRSSPDVFTQCATSSAAHVPMDMSLSTKTPLVSDATSAVAARTASRSALTRAQTGAGAVIAAASAGLPVTAGPSGAPAGTTAACIATLGTAMALRRRRTPVR